MISRKTLLRNVAGFFVSAKELKERGFQFFKGAFVWDKSGIRIIGIMRVSVRLGAILIPEYLDFHSGYSAPRSRIVGRARIMTSLSRCNQRWRRVQMKVLRLSSERRASGGAERTLCC